MVNILIASNNIFYATNLLNYINKRETNIRVAGIATNVIETLEKLNEDIDIVLLDVIMPLCNEYEVLEKMKTQEKYKKSFIIISPDMRKIEELRKYDIIYKIIPKCYGMDNITNHIKELVLCKDMDKKRREIHYKVRTELLFVGYDFAHNGTKYLQDAIEYIFIELNKDFDVLEKNVYPIVAKKYKKSVHNIKCSINRATTMMYCQCDSKKLAKYFHEDNDAKPKIKTIINIIINKI